MTIWMDLTNSLRIFKGRVVGIIRAELEIAKNLHDIDSNIRFSICTGNGFREVKFSELEWLWNADSVSDAYIRHFKRFNSDLNSFENKNLLRSEYPDLDNAYNFSDSRLIRIKEATKLTIKALPSPLNSIFFYPSKLVYKGIKKIKSCSNAFKSTQRKVHIEKFEHPYKNGDIVFSCGWINSEKERCFSRVLNENSINIIYLIYDIIIAKKEFKHLYTYDYEVFNKYLYWTSCNCKKIIYGGHTAQIDTENYFRKNNWRVPSGDYVKFGSSIYNSNDSDNYDQDVNVLKKYNITGDFIITVGTIEPRKNIKTLYRAYCILLKEYEYREIPILVIVGNNWGENDLSEKIINTPLVNKKIIIIQPTDNELDILYKKSKFVLLPSLYEGWSLTLPEGLNYGKLCICSDVAPLREIANNVAVFVSPLDAKAWANTIINFYSNDKKIKKYENLVVERWQSTKWFNTAERIYQIISDDNYNEQTPNSFSLYYDLTLLYWASLANSSVSGILRTQLLLLRCINKIHDNIKYFALTPNGYISYNKNDLYYLLSDAPVDECFEKNKSYIINKNVLYKSDNIISDYVGLKHRFKIPFWLFLSVLPYNMQKRILKYFKIKKITKTINSIYKLPFTKNDVVFSVGAGFDVNSYEVLKENKAKNNFAFVQLVYDYTPIIVPQTHRGVTIDFYEPFLKYTNLISDVIFYGGKTAMRDGIYYQKKHDQIVRPSHVVKFGSNMVGKSPNLKEITNMLDKYNLNGDFILTVGSIEARKNHEILYDAYLYLIEKGIDNIPKLVICGYPGWKTGDFVSRMINDERTKEYIIIKSFSDFELDVLYRKCLFTVLPSLYEGWSLTLPESLNYGKFCIASAVDPLIEIGQDFIDYANPYDVKEWAEKIMYYCNNRDELFNKEKRIHDEWHTITWDECAENVVAALDQLATQGASSFKEGDEFLNE